MPNSHQDLVSVIPEQDYPTLPHLSLPLTWQGPWPARRPRIAVVGSRKASPRQLAFARQLAAWIGQMGGVVVSGGALGIDAAALTAALDGDQPAVAVLPRAPDQPYPAQHGPLYQRLLQRGGAIVALADTHVVLPRWAFAQRNRVLVELVDGVIAVAAEVPSGTLQAAMAAWRAGKPVAQVPWPQEEYGHAGVALLAAAGAEAVRDHASLLAWLAGPVAQAAVGQRPMDRAGLRQLTAALAGRQKTSLTAKAPHTVDGDGSGRQSYRPARSATDRAMAACGEAPRPLRRRDGLTPDEAKVVEVLENSAERRGTLEGIVAQLNGDRLAAGQALLMLVLRGDVTQGADGSYSLTLA